VSVPDGCFRIELCAILGEESITLAASRSFTMPNLFEPRLIDVQAEKNPLLRLSGTDDFEVIHNMERDCG
jgi:hypothetical protein